MQLLFQNLPSKCFMTNSKVHVLGQHERYFFFYFNGYSDIFTGL